VFEVFATMEQRLPLSRVPAHAARAEALGCDGLTVPEAVHDGLLAAAAALRGTTRIRVATGVLLAFPRSPMAVAIAAWDLAEASGGRFELGLGSQVRGNVEGRYGVAWTAPVPRMRGYVGALRAIFTSFQTGAPLRYESEQYRFGRLQPFFRPDPLAKPRIPILLGAIGPAMTSLAGEVADGLVTHPTSSAPRVLREIVLGRLAHGAARTGRDAGSLTIAVSPLVATGCDDAAVERGREAARQLLGFLFSTPAYWPGLELFGWRERGEALHRLSREGRWDAMATEIDGALLDAFVPSAPYATLGDELAVRYAGLARRLCLPLPDEPDDDEAFAALVAELQGRQGAAQGDGDAGS
jgi:probable F420-dependent oxidoreductase